MILIIREPVTLEQLNQMKLSLGSRFIKLAVDVKREILAGGGEFHADCEEVLLGDGSQQQDIWGADWVLTERQVEYESMINFRPTQQNFKSVVQDETLRAKIDNIVRYLLEVNL